jgi:uncharacterized protein YtpQ (UPF0354 family)
MANSECPLKKIVKTEYVAHSSNTVVPVIQVTSFDECSKEKCGFWDIKLNQCKEVPR